MIIQERKCFWCWTFDLNIHNYFLIRKSWNFWKKSIIFWLKIFLCTLKWREYVRIFLKKYFVWYRKHATCIWDKFFWVNMTIYSIFDKRATFEILNQKFLSKNSLFLKNYATLMARFPFLVPCDALKLLFMIDDDPWYQKSAMIIVRKPYFKNTPRKSEKTAFFYDFMKKWSISKFKLRVFLF